MDSLPPPPGGEPPRSPRFNMVGLQHELGVIREDKSGVGSSTAAAKSGPSWRLAQHTVTVNRTTGERIALDTIAGLTHARAMSIGSSDAMMSGGGRSRSKTITSDPRSLHHTLLAHMEIFHKASYEWHPPDYMLQNYRAIIDLCRQAAEVFKREPRLVEIKGPAYIMGDLHGNFQDLTAFGHAFWKQGANVCPASLVFLGDYVDRRFFGVEVCIYLFSQKLTAPNKVVLLRGNHETRDVNGSFGFLEECQRKFGTTYGQEVWEEFNRAFDCLPLACCVGGTIFCAHGGIPGPELAVDMMEINKVACPLNSEDDSPLARDLMWSDPMEEDSGQDFEPNSDRGVSHKFSTKALERFLQRNNLEFVIRAHQYKIHLGFQVQKRAKLVTVFSSSAYGGQLKNEAACVLAADGKLRMMRLDSLADKMDTKPTPQGNDQSPPLSA